MVPLFIIVSLVCLQQSESTSDSIISNIELKMDEKLLSRHRRYLVFPEGSSLQLGMWLVIYKSANMVG